MCNRINTDKMHLTFVKLCSKWYVDIPGYTDSLAELEMVGGAKQLLDAIIRTYKGEQCHEVHARIATDTDSYSAIHPNLEMTLVKEDDLGGTYSVDSFGFPDRENTKTVWLCNICRAIYGNNPKKFYLELY